MKKIPLIIDTDPGIDDAVAIAIALFSDEVDVKLITTVEGNVNVEKTTLNALRLLSFYNKKVPVAKGFSQPLIRKYQDASDIHGQTGMEGFDFPDYDATNLVEEHAVEKMRQVLIRSNEPVVIMPIGPLTNIGVLLRMYPEVKQKIKQIVLMGGAIGRGNRRVYAEFNIGVDPEAAKIVFESGLDIVMAPMDLGPQALVYREDSEKIKKMNLVGKMFYSLFKNYRSGSFETGLKMYDSCAIAYLLAPKMFTAQKVYVEVDVQSDLSAGQTYVDLRNFLKQKPNVTVLTDLDSKQFKKWFLAAIAKCNIN